MKKIASVLARENDLCVRQVKNYKDDDEDQPPRRCVVLFIVINVKKRSVPLQRDVFFHGRCQQKYQRK